MSTPTPVPAPAPASPAPRRRRSFSSYVWGSLIGALLLIALYTLFMLWWSYSEGERAGVLQKFSKRGWVCKTYEGELAMYVVAGVAPQVWKFSVRDDGVVQQLNDAVGQQVRRCTTRNTRDCRPTVSARPTISPHALGPDHRGLLAVVRARPAVQRRPQLRPRGPRDAASPGGAAS